MPELEAKVKVWRSGEWVCLLVEGGGRHATISLTRDEATQLRQLLEQAEQPHEG